MSREVIASLASTLAIALALKQFVMSLFFALAMIALYIDNLDFV